MIPFFQKIIDILNESNIPYMLSGSMAMSMYIDPRATRDFDFIIYLKPDDVDRFCENFKEDYYCDKDAINDAVKRYSMFNIIDPTANKADFIFLKNEPFRQEEFGRKIKMDFWGKVIYVVSPEDLLISKLIWIQELQSELQMEDIKNLARLESLDWEYISKWVGRLKLKTFNLINE